MPTYHEEDEDFSIGQPSALEQLINEVVSLINDLVSTHLVNNKARVVLSVTLSSKVRLNPLDVFWYKLIDTVTMTTS